MPKVVRVRRPINFLIEENSIIIDELDFSYSLLDLVTVLAVVIGKFTLVFLFKSGDDFHSIITSGIFGGQHTHSQLTDGRNGWVDHTA
jgi:hypothetical protein